MKIRLVLIPPDDLTNVMRLTGDLRSAVNAGDMDGVDAATQELIDVTATTRSVDITEEEWRIFLTQLRAENASFQSDYVVPGHLCSRFFPDATSETMVLLLPFTDPEVDDV